MITSDKIEEWMKEAEERPAYAPMIIQFIANRLRELAERNEELMAENIALVSGKRVEEYEQRIAHLEYQLNLLKRQLGGELPAIENLAEAAASPSVETINLLVYDAQGHVLRIPVPADALSNGSALARLAGTLVLAGEAPRLLAVPASEELLFLFTSGRVTAMPVETLPAVEKSPAEWMQSPVPDEPRAGETLACLAPISKLALAESFVQVSRRGCVKKIRTAMAQSILANHYIGAGVKQPPDKALDLRLCGKNDRLVLISRAGYLTCVDARMLPFAVEEVMRLAATDHLVAAFVPEAQRSIVAMTQIGKAIHWTEERLETANSFKSRGQALFSAQRREQGVRVIGAASAGEGDWAAVLLQNGQVTLHSVRDLVGAGSLPVQGDLLAFTTFSVPGQTVKS